MLYVIAGNGTGNATEIAAALKDLREAAQQKAEDFWVLLESKEDPTKTDEAIYKWLRTNEVWFEALTSTGITLDDAQETVGTDDVWASMLERIHERAEENEDAALLVLVDEDAEDDALLGFIEQALDADVNVYQLNGEMAKLALDEAPEPVAPVKAATKKAAPAKAAAPAKKASKRASVSEEDVREAEILRDVAEAEAEAAALAEGVTVVYTNEELTKMTVPELTALAKGQGIDVKGLGKKDLIAAVQQMTSVPAAAVLDAEVAAEIMDGEMALVVVHLPKGGFLSRMVPLMDAKDFLAAD